MPPPAEPGETIFQIDLCAPDEADDDLRAEITPYFLPQPARNDVARAAFATIVVTDDSGVIFEDIVVVANGEPRPRFELDSFCS